MKTKRILFSIGGGVLIPVLSFAASVALSDNFDAEGPDNPTASLAALPYTWVFYLADALGLGGTSAGLVLVYGGPVLVYSALVFVVLTVLDVPSSGQNASMRQAARLPLTGRRRGW